MFIEEVDPVTGEVGWKVADEDYDLAQEIARSRFGDMLHDIERNHLYQTAVYSVIQQMHKSNEPVHVLDIGTGTGLLAMMAVRAGAEKVTAVEVFKPMADCAERIFRFNGFENKIKLIKNRSTDLPVCSEVERANCIVAEVFDTELIGEGALRTFKEAHETVANMHCRVIPASARVWVVPVESNFLKKFHALPNKNLSCPFSDCVGSAAVFDVQLSNVPRGAIEMLCEPFVAFEFDFEDGSSINYEETFIHPLVVTSGKAHHIDAILMWWELDMDGSGKYILSTAPKWWNLYAEWRDHWMQAVYYLPNSPRVSLGEVVNLQCSHDEVSFWFSVSTDGTAKKERPYCSCGIHTTCSRNAVYRLNQIDEDQLLLNHLFLACEGKTVLAINSGSLLGLIMAKHAKTMFILEYNKHFRSAMQKYCEENNLKNIRFLENTDGVDANVDLILSEPYFFSSLLPWDSLRIWHTTQQLLDSHFFKNTETLPNNFALYAMPVHFEHLWKVIAPVGIVEGFDLSEFDQICRKARSATDELIEAHPLWEYASISTGNPVMLLSAVFQKGALLCEENPKMLIFRPRVTNAIVFWMSWGFNNCTRKNGPLNEPVVGNSIEWAIGERQGVYFLPDEKRLDLTCDSVTITPKMNLHSNKLLSDGEIFKFSFNFCKRSLIKP